MEFVLVKKRDQGWDNLAINIIPLECTILKIVMPDYTSEYKMNNNVLGFAYVIRDILRRFDKLKVLDLSACMDLEYMDNNFHFSSKSIEKIILPNSVRVIDNISNCPNLKEIVAENAESIYCISNCSNLKEVVAKNAESINYISDCPNLINLNVNQSCKFLSLDNVGIYSFDFSYRDEISFRNCKNLCSIKFSHKVSIPNWGMRNCSNLHMVILPKGSTIGKGTFTDCVSLTYVKLPNDMEEIPDEAFYNCTKLKQIDGCKSKVCAGSKAFLNCFSLKELSFEVSNIYADLFENEHKEEYGIVLGFVDNYAVVMSCDDSSFVFSKDIEENLSRSKSREDICGQVVLMEKVTRYNWNIDSYKTKINYLPYVLVVLLGIIETPAQLERSDKIDALKKYMAFRDTGVKNIHDIHKMFEEKVAALDIPQIIDSYHTTIKEWEKKNVGKDNDFFYSKDVEAIYTDAYMETLLPSYHYSYHDSGYTSVWPWTSEEEKIQIQCKDAERRAEALKMYDRNKHIDFLVDNFFFHKIEDAFFIESYLHIKQAKEEFVTVSWFGKFQNTEELLIKLHQTPTLRNLYRKYESMTLREIFGFSRYSRW